MPTNLDAISAAQEDKNRLRREQEGERIRQMTADMASEIERIKAEDWKPPFDVDAVYIPEKPAPLDWFIRGEIAKAANDPVEPAPVAENP